MATGGSTPGFSGTNGGPTIGTAFPLRQSALSFNSTSLSADAATNSGGATATLTSFVPDGSGGQNALITISIPSLGVNQANVTTGGDDNTITSGAQAGKLLDFTSDSLNYVLFGSWSIGPATPNAPPDYVGFFTSGYQTPSSALPTSGTATYGANGSTDSGTGTGMVAGVVAVPSGSSFDHASLTGNASLAVTFGGSSAGSIAGTFSGMTATPDSGGASTAWNGVTVTGTIAGGAATFTGTTAATGTPGGTYGLSTSATGVIDGAFYGPTGQELGAIWSLHDGSGVNGKAAIGVVSATKLP